MAKETIKSEILEMNITDDSCKISLMTKYDEDHPSLLDGSIVSGSTFWQINIPFGHPCVKFCFDHIGKNIDVNLTASKAESDDE